MSEAVLALVHAACVAGTAWLVGHTVAAVATGAPPSGIAAPLTWMAILVVVRAASVWARDAVAARAAAAVKHQLRSRLTAAISRLGPTWVARRHSAWLGTVLGPGTDSLDGYIRGYLPQLVLTLVATPVIVVALFVQDVLTGVIVVVTLPLIPLFMVLIGMATRFVQAKHWSALGSLSVAFLDVVEGLATLKIFGREHQQYARIRSATGDLRTQTMRVLRVSFLSGFVLELIASLSVAVVAVSVGTRLIDGSLPLATGLSVLILTPEAYLPIRQVGAQFHAAAEGVTAAEDAFAILDEDEESQRPALPGPRLLPPSPRTAPLVLTAVGITYDGHDAVSALSAVFSPGTLTAVTGPSGAGKSSLLAAVLGFVPSAGSITLGELDLTSLDEADRLGLIAWSGQRPGLVRGTVAENVALGDCEPVTSLTERALRQAGAEEISPALVLSATGTGLSGGQAQRVAIARALYRAERFRTLLLLLDEPTSALDARHERHVIAGLAEQARQGRIVVAVSHRPAVVAAADNVLQVPHAPTGVSRVPATTGGVRA